MGAVKGRFMQLLQVPVSNISCEVLQLGEIILVI